MKLVQESPSCRATIGNPLETVPSSPWNSLDRIVIRVCNLLFLLSGSKKFQKDLRGLVCIYPTTVLCSRSVYPCPVCIPRKEIIAGATVALKHHTLRPRAYADRALASRVHARNPPGTRVFMYSNPRAHRVGRLLALLIEPFILVLAYAHRHGSPRICRRHDAAGRRL